VYASVFLELTHLVGFPLMPKRTFLRPQNKSKTSKIVDVDVMTVSNERMFTVTGQDVSIHPLFGLYRKHSHLVCLLLTPSSI